MSNTSIKSFPADYIDGLLQSSKSKISGISTLKNAEESPVTNIHLVEGGDVLITSSQTIGVEGHVVIRGAIEAFAYEGHFTIELSGDEISITLDLEKPIDLPPYTWKFNLHGIIKDTSGNIINAADVKPSFDVTAKGLDWWCVLKCGGTGILATLVTCLPALAGGPAAYVACVTSKLGSTDAAQIAVCIAKKCA